MKKLIIIVSIAAVLSGCTSTVNTDSNGGNNGNNSIPKAEQVFADDFKPVSQYPISKDMVELLLLNSLSEEQVIEALVLAQKLGKDGKAVLDKIKAGKTEENIIAECLEEKYQL